MLRIAKKKSAKKFISSFDETLSNKAYRTENLRKSLIFERQSLSELAKFVSQHLTVSFSNPNPFIFPSGAKRFKSRTNLIFYVFLSRFSRITIENEKKISIKWLI